MSLLQTVNLSICSGYLRFNPSDLTQNHNWKKKKISLDSHSSSEYSDWTADAGINLKPSTPQSSRKRRRQLSSSEEEEENEETEDKQQETGDEEETPGKKSRAKAKKSKSRTPKVSDSTHQNQPSRLSLVYHLNPMSVLLITI